ncbi:hypothetical protein ABZX40_34305 [Streptomyces sp. NPDC004610]|uniref:hypothetical protein n=1 Tax=unclassified Streptomyces TaxID=2593676 RepID=UPI0033B9B0FC
MGKSKTVKAVRAEAIRAAKGQPTGPQDNQEAAERRALMREASNEHRRLHARERVQLSENGPGVPDPH